MIATSELCAGTAKRTKANTARSSQSNCLRKCRKFWRTGASPARARNGMIFRLSDFSIALAVQCSRRNSPKATADFIDIIVAPENMGLAPKSISKKTNCKNRLLKSCKQLLCPPIGQKKCWKSWSAKKNHKPNQQTLSQKRTEKRFSPFKKSWTNCLKDIWTILLTRTPTSV